jgi:TolB-like protein
VERALAGEGDKLKEYVIGVEVFDRNEQYDPRVDSIVRVEAGRLRGKIAEYYHVEGCSDSVIIMMRRGSYAPVFEQRESTAPAPMADGADPSTTVGRLAGSRLGLAVLVALVVPLAIVAWRAGLWKSRGAPRSVTTIAVLPFEHYSTDGADQALAARVTDGVTSELARIGTLGVVSRTSALQFAGIRKPLREVARALNADIVMEASVVREGDYLRIQARLVDAALDRKFWMEDFAGKVTDIRELQRRIAIAAAAAASKPRSR